MRGPARVVGLECPRCHTTYEAGRHFTGCERCRAERAPVNLTVKYDLHALDGIAPADWPSTPRGMWRFQAVLPTRIAPVTLGEGATPLIPLARLGKRLGLPRLYAKDESQNPTWSYKDRLCSVAVTHALEHRARVVTVASTGNHGASTAAYAARAGVPCVIFTLAAVPDTMKTLMQAYGAAVVACPTPESRWTLMRQGVEQLGWYPTGGFILPPVGSNPYGVDGYKTIAYEIAEELGWTVPDILIVPSAYGDGLFGIWKGWVELETLGLTKMTPRMIAAEPFGPLADALARNLDVPEMVDGGPSVAFSIASRYGTYQGLAALKQSGGHGVRLTDEGIFEAQRALGREEGLFVEPSAAAALAALMQLRAREAVDGEQTIVLVLTSSGLKDPVSSRTWMPPVPASPPDLRGLLRLLVDSYGLALDA